MWEWSDTFIYVSITPPCSLVILFWLLPVHFRSSSIDFFPPSWLAISWVLSWAIDLSYVGISTCARSFNDYPHSSRPSLRRGSGRCCNAQTAPTAWLPVDVLASWPHGIAGVDNRGPDRRWCCASGVNPPSSWDATRLSSEEGVWLLDHIKVLPRRWRSAHGLIVLFSVARCGGRGNKHVEGGISDPWPAHWDRPNSSWCTDGRGWCITKMKKCNNDH